MGKSLVVYYSRTGTAETVAKRLADRLAADLDAVRPSHGYAGRGGFLRGVLESITGQTPSVGSSRHIGDYALVILVAPVWAGRLAAPMRRYLRQHGADLGAVGAVWVSGSGGAYPAVGREIEAALGHRPITTLALGQSAVETDKIDLDLAAFCARVSTA